MARSPPGPVLTQFPRLLQAHAGRIIALIGTPDGKTLITYGEDKELRWWDFATGQLIRSNILSFPVTSLALSPDGATLVCASASGTRKRSNGATFNYAGGISKRDALSPQTTCRSRRSKWGSRQMGKISPSPRALILTSTRSSWMCRQKHGVPDWTVQDDELISHLIAPNSWLEPRFGIFVRSAREEEAPRSQANGLQPDLFAR